MTVSIISAQLYTIPNPCMYVGGFLAAPHPDYELLVTFACVGSQLSSVMLLLKGCPWALIEGPKHMHT